MCRFWVLTRQAPFNIEAEVFTNTIFRVDYFVNIKGGGANNHLKILRTFLNNIGWGGSHFGPPSNYLFGPIRPCSGSHNHIPSVLKFEKSAKHTVPN